MTRLIRRFVVSAAALLAAACAVDPSANAVPQADRPLTMPADRVSGPYSVTRVVDGDTIWIDLDGRRTKVRLTGLDTPEVKDPRKPVQCFGVAASEQAALVLSGRQVFLETDASQAKSDRYGRDLAYVWTTDGHLFNFDMIAGGFAHEYTYDAPYRYQAEFRAAEADARQHQRGLWAPNACP